MFGYLRPYKPEMKMKDFSLYKAVYCGLCRTLGKRYGFISRMLLTYDATLMSILVLSLNKDCDGFSKCFCPASVIKKCDAVNLNEATDFFSDVTVLLSYYKVKDNISDSTFFKKIGYCLSLPFFSLQFKRAKKNNLFAYELSENYIVKQNEVEKEKTSSIDKASDPTAELMSKLLVKFSKTENERRILERLGYFLGRWIYLCDAIEDRVKDEKTGNYNLFNLIKDKNQDEVNTLAEKSLNSCIFEVTSAVSLLDINKYKDIIYNSFYLGMPEMEKAVFSGLSKKEKQKKFSSIYKL